MLLTDTVGFVRKLPHSLIEAFKSTLEEAMLADTDHSTEIPDDILADLANRPIEDNEWDGYERSVLRRKADAIKVGIRGNVVDMTVSKRFE